MNPFTLPLINTHTHAAMIPFRGLGTDQTLDKWLNDYIWPAEKKYVNRDFVFENTKKAISEMQRNMIVAFSDMYFFEEAVGKVCEEEGMYALIGEALLDFPTPSAKNFDEGLEITKKLFEQFENSKYVKVAVAPHACFTVSPDNLQIAEDLAKEYNAPIHIHCSETQTEVKECKEKYGKTPVQHFDELGLLNEKTILAHCVWLTDEDIATLSERDCFISHCPLSNLKLGSGIAPISKLIDRGVKVTLGTDGPASSDRLDVWEAGKFAALLQKGVNHNAAIMKINEVYKMMSINGIEALGLRDKIVFNEDMYPNPKELFLKNINEL